MVVVTRKYQVTIPKKVREQLKLKVGDDIIFMREDNGGYRLAKVEDFTREFCESCKGVEKTVEETRKGLGRGIKE